MVNLVKKKTDLVLKFKEITPTDFTIFFFYKNQLLKERQWSSDEK